jgi:gamma-glutamyltranspeptidase/glutathione hydrolase
MTDAPTNLYTEHYPYPSRRMPVLAARGVVATSEPLAAQAGLSMLQRGGNAVDAALATAIALTVVEPTSNGIGGDAFALVWDGSKLHGLNGSGRAPATHMPELFARQGLDAVPAAGWLPVTVPGAPATWRDLHARFGKLPFATLFEPAITYARDGYPVGPVTAQGWARAREVYARRQEAPEFAPWFDTFAPGSRAPRPGDIARLSDHAATLRTIAASGAEDFYHGALARRIADFAAATGGYLTRDDLAAHTSTWVDPISTSYRGYEVWEIPPNGQGVAALAALNILEGFDLAAHPRESVESYHLQIEAMKLAFSDTFCHVGDMEHGDIPLKGMLDKVYAAERRVLIGDRALEPAPGMPPRGGTVYLCAADGDGLMVSYIQSNYMGFGSGVVVPGTGIALQNRGACFVLEPGHPNRVAPGKRPYHTIIPAFLTRGGQAVGPFGVIGGYMQPQGHLQMVVNTVDYGMNPQTSLDAPRWQWLRGKDIEVEMAAAQHIISGLDARGHRVAVQGNVTGFGRGQIIWRLPNGAYVAGSEPRADGCAVGY